MRAVVHPPPDNGDGLARLLQPRRPISYVLTVMIMTVIITYHDIVQFDMTRYNVMQHHIA